MKKNTLVFLGFLILSLSFDNVLAQLTFKNANNRLNSAGHSGCSISVTDWNGDGLDDIIRLNQGKDIIVEIQHPNAVFESRSLGSFSANTGWAWAMCVADIDHNGYKDIIAGGNSSAVKVMMIDNSGMSSNIINLANSAFFLQNLTFCDFNNDGWIDIFCCDDNNAAHMYLNDGSGNLLPSAMIDFALNPTVFYNGDPADSGNYGSAWTDFDNDGDLDLYIAHCRQGVNSPTDLRRINRLFVNDGNNNFTEMAANYGLDIGWQSWTASFGDIDNDGDFDLMLTNHDHESQLLQNDGNGHFIDITAATGFNITDITPIESMMEDFDNDGWIDILATGSDSRFYKNNGNGTFSRITSLFDNNKMESFATGDLNHDGFIDIYGGYASIYTTPTSVDDVIWLNSGNDNHFFNLNLKGTLSNADAIGARAYIYGSWGVQTREVRSGESYGTTNSSALHFGLGQATIIDSLIINWPSGFSQTIINPSIDQFLTVREADCISPEAIINYAGSLILCTGQTLTLNAPPGMSYLWSTGETTQSITLATQGEFNVLISQAGNNCTAVSKTIKTQLNPDETPVIYPDGDLEFCSGLAVNILSPMGYSSYLWNNGDTGQNLHVTQNGTYYLTVLGHCQAWTSDSIQVIVHTVADPGVVNVSIPLPAVTTLNATGLNLSWYDQPTGGIAIGNGNSFITPFISTTTTFYVEDAESYGGGIFTGGKPNHTGSSQFSSSDNTNATTSFNILEACTLNTVKVYTDLAGVREIYLKNNLGTIMQSATVNIIPDSQVVSLNWFIPVGNDYTIGTVDSVNMAIPGWGNLGPRLKRNNGDVTYPYTINGLLEITGSSQGNSLYYYFYDWQVEKVTYTCLSNRLPVTVTVLSGVGISELQDAKISLYPNPANDMLHVDIGKKTSSILQIFDLTGRLIKTDMITSEHQLIDISAISKGVYQAKIKTDSDEAKFKIVIN